MRISDWSSDVCSSDLQWLVRSFGEAERDGQPISVLFVDMDHFKAINDKYGHACGDHCLRMVAQGLRAALGDGDLLGRYGGEEFIAVLPARGGAAARMVGEQLRDRKSTRMNSSH